MIERLLAPHEEQLRQAESMPGWGRRSAQDAIAETGTDMTRFPAGAHLASWAGRTPLDPIPLTLFTLAASFCWWGGVWWRQRW